ncbi:MAG: ParB/RepB/Spo0J family partition protein [Actinobacteria bacterium]|nr:ParB/RepB/Spo0J family partition protein [Actinomycetota bacterium]
MVKRGLGKGLSALIPVKSNEEIDLSIVEEIETEKVVPNLNQPRKNFEEESLNELVESIKKVGLIQPVMVRPKGEHYEIVAGERRLKAAIVAGKKKIPAVVKDVSDEESLQIALIENLQREDLNPFEEANAYLQLSEKFGMNHKEIGEIVGKEGATIRSALTLLQLPLETQGLIIKNNIPAGHARALLPLKDAAKQKKIIERIIPENLSVRQVESIVRFLLNITDTKGAKKQAQLECYKTAAGKLSSYLDARVRVRGNETNGRIEIAFKTEEELERILIAIVEKA